MPYRFYDGEVCTLGRRLGSGGEAIVYEVHDRPRLAAKVYHRWDIERQRKLQAMLGTVPHDPTLSRGHTSIAWPQAPVFDDSGLKWVGFLMPKLPSSQKPLGAITHPATRRQVAAGFDWRHLMNTGANLAQAVTAIHEAKCVVGDLNESNVLVANSTLVTLVDCDSMQVPNANGGCFRCTVGKVEFTPPELAGETFSLADKTVSTDNFALAVAAFQLVRLGAHPYQGRPSGSAETLSPSDFIRKGETVCGPSDDMSSV